MRSAQKNNRSRGRSNRKGGGGGGGGSIVNRVYDSAGPEGKVRGTPQQIIDKYLSLARDSQTSGDRVMSENFLQHAEHYQRLLMQATAQAEQNRREQVESGTEDEGDERDAARDDRRAQPVRQQQERQEADGESAGSDEIGGMTMIDSPGGSDDLLVVTEDVSQTKPRRNGDGRRRRPRQGGDGGQGGSDGPDDTATAAQQES